MAHNNNIGFKFCRKGHALGRMIRNGSGAEFLELFRLAIDYSVENPEQPDVIGVFPVGFQIRCNLCSAVVDFHQSPRYAGAVKTFGEQEE